MPFHDDYDDTYNLAIKLACDEAGAYCERLDEQIFVENMLDRIFTNIAKADIIIADMTGRNPNVFYETGYAHALKKPVIALTKNAEDIPFDLKHFPHIIYGKSLSFLKKALADRLPYLLESTVARPSLPALDYLVDGRLVDNGMELEVIAPETGIFSISLSARNASSHRIAIEEGSIAALVTYPEGTTVSSSERGDRLELVYHKPGGYSSLGFCGFPCEEGRFLIPLIRLDRVRLLPNEPISQASLPMIYSGTAYNMPLTIRSFFQDDIVDLRLHVSVIGA